MVNKGGNYITIRRSECRGKGANNTCGDRTPRGIVCTGITD